MELEKVLVSEEIKQELFILLGLWSCSLNFEDYTKEYYPGESFSYLEEVEDLSPVARARSKNRFAFSELEGIKERISEVKSIFEKFHFKPTPRAINNHLKKIQNQHKYDQQFLDLIRTEDLELEELTLLIKNQLEYNSLSSILYFCCIIYHDLFKIHEFLHASYNATVEDDVKEARIQKETSELDSKLKLTQIALLFFYEGGRISRDNADATAEEYGWCAKTSGHKLYQHFNKLSENIERTGDPGSKIKLKNKIKLIESVLEHLSNAASRKAQEEIKQLRNLFVSRYE